MWQIVKVDRVTKLNDEIIEEHETKEQAKYFADVYNRIDSSKWEWFRYDIQEKQDGDN